jgi:hypothetical protein
MENGRDFCHETNNIGPMPGNTGRRVCYVRDPSFSRSSALFVTAFAKEAKPSLGRNVSLPEKALVN